MDLGAHEHVRETHISVRTNGSKDEARAGGRLLAGILDVRHQYWHRGLANLR